MDAHAVPGRRPVAEALRAGRELTEVVLAEERGPLADLAGAARDRGVPVRTADRGQLDQLAGGVAHQGVVALAGAYPYAGLAAVAGADLAVMCDGVTDPQNLGAIARSAEAAGASGLVVAKRRSAHVTPAVEKAAAGALSWLAVVVVPNLVRALADLAEEGAWSVGLDGDADAALWDSVLLGGPCVLVVGAEGAGLSRLVAERVDERVAIPLSGQVGSLNASAAAAVGLFEARRRRHAG